MFKHQNNKICIVGLGYVGLPLALAFGKQETINAFDINTQRIKDLKNNLDTNNESSTEDLQQARINFSTDPKIISESNFIIIAVPTPIDKNNNPDLQLLLSATKLVGQYLKKDSIVVYESTVYPGCTERDCVPLLEQESGLKYQEDFKVGYSPERINPGDKIHTVDKITKVVSGSDEEALEIIATTYNKVINQVYKATSIKIAEAAKIIENTQRDVNIALMNELKMIFDKADIKWFDVLKAANTKWNFLDFTPGLVGGHCIGVDPYYLATEAIRLGHHPEIILAGRKINDQMAKYEAQRFLAKNIDKDKKILVLGGTFKPNISDIRNSKVEMFITELKNHGYSVDICEPHVKKDLFNCQNIDIKNVSNYDIIIKAVNHDLFKDLKFDYEILFI